jgi:O-antigen ligase
VFVLGWTTFGFAGLYPSTLVVPALVCAVLAIVYRPWKYHGEAIPALHVCLALTVAAIGAQLVRLPAVLIDTISPADRRAWEHLSLVVPSALPISIDPERTARALLVTIGGVALFLVARRIFSTGGVRSVVRGVSLIGMLLSAIALAQDATANGLMYWRWKPVDEGPPPFGPFVNRNHFATWAILGVPLCLGYLAAHTQAHRHHAPAEGIPWRRRFVTFFDGRAMVLTAAACLMMVALVMTLSRSGLAGIGAAAALGIVLRVNRGTVGGRTLWWIAAGSALAIALTLAETTPAALAHRVATVGVSASGRLLIWRDTMSIVKDFWLTGTGAGTYVTSMLLYQRSSPGWLYNQAHNHYLQIVSEGGLLVGLPAFLALALYVREAWSRLQTDKSGMYWLRAGACCGLAGVATQSLWETGLTMPANAALAALAAAIAIHGASTRLRS